MEKLTTLNRIHKEKIMAVVRVETVERGAEIVEGCLAGGVSILEISYTNANAGEIIQQDVYKRQSNQHIEVVDTVISKFKYFNAKQISDYSHEESAYTNTNHNEPISYEYALELQPI